MNHENQRLVTDNRKQASATPWQSRLVKKGYLDSPVMETTPFVFNGRLYRLENWQSAFSIPDAEPGANFLEDRVEIRDVQTDEIVAAPLTGHTFGAAFVWDGRVYIFAGRFKPDAWRKVSEVVMISSNDLVHWTEPQIVLVAKSDEHFYNFAVCRGRESFVLLYETDDLEYAPPFTFKYCSSDDLIHWKPIPDAVYGKGKYVGGPALYFEGDTYYTLYLHDMGGRWETRITRSKDLVHWEDAPEGRPFLTFDPTQQTHCRLRPPVDEINASDAELCEWQGKTIVYFSGANQEIAIADLQWAEFDGTPRELLEHFFE